jgi:SpoVK/Ycf46/Vps4 family AAA+-type ATPase
VVRTAEQAARAASHARRDLTEADLREAARHQNGSAILSLARRIVPTARWEDLVITAAVQQQLRELLDRVRLAPQVFDRWDLRISTRRGQGIKAMFCGPPGTGKTMAAEVIARELGLDLFVIDLSSVVDKYIGETEKHLERLFRAASEANGVLFFDEADALFGKRSDVREAKDRYANIETSYLLQRIDAFEGFVVLATNLRSNLDGAFTRRLDVIVEMLMPQPMERLALWNHCLGSQMPRDSDVDLPFLAKSFELSGGNIRNVALTAAFFAANRDGFLRMEDLVWSVQREYRKLGRLLSESEFGPWWKLVSG